MKLKISWILISVTVFVWVCQSKVAAKVIRVPAGEPTIQAAINSAANEDTILISPGTYFESLTLTKELTIASEFLTTKDEAFIRETIVDGKTKTVFNVTGPKNGISNIIGLTIQNGDDGIMAAAPINLLNNFITACDDGIDYESSGGGLCKNNIFRFNTDDGIDLDGTLLHIIVEDNIVSDNDDDGIEIRLHDYTGLPSYCLISGNKIYNNKEDGIQFIDYPGVTPRTYRVERNLIYNNLMAGIACMDKGESKEDYRGAAIPEPIYILNNTISGHNYGISGGANLFALNNIIINSTTYGAFKVSARSVISHSLFYNNGADTANCNLIAQTNLFADPKLSGEFVPETSSPCIDKGIKLYISESDTLLNIPEKLYSGLYPDIGAIENSLQTSSLINIVPKNEIFVRPVPFNNYFEVIALKEDFSCVAQILNESGQLMSNLTLKNFTIVSTENYKEGVYFLRYLENEGWKTLKILKFQ
jgi:hypothetical protein